MKALLLLISLVILGSCKQESEPDSAAQIVEKAIERAGGEVIENAAIAFKFRDYYYRATRQEGAFSLERCTDPECEEVRDILSNAGFKRLIYNQQAPLPDSLVSKYRESVNSVHYFSVLPYGLDAPSVKTEMAGDSKIKGESYYQVKVSFKPQGGGTDYEDTYMYWIHKEKYTVDYLAYNYQVNEGGTRFREAYNAREIEGVRIVDYRNYRPEEQYPPLDSLDELFEAGKLELLSIIELEDVTVISDPDR